MIARTVGKAREYVGGLSRPSKMPGWGYSIPASYCKVGSILSGIVGSICSFCYAKKGRYIFPVVQAAMERRFRALEKPYWIENMAKAINGSTWFRWHDSGDLQSVEHLEKIVAVAQLTPTTRHWLPTRENKMVLAYLEDSVFPSNLCVRVSSAMVGGKPLDKFPNTSTVHVPMHPSVGHSCPARYQDNKCGDCRACWNTDVANVSYPQH